VFLIIFEFLPEIRRRVKKFQRYGPHFRWIDAISAPCVMLFRFPSLGVPVVDFKWGELAFIGHGWVGGDKVA